MAHFAQVVDGVVVNVIVAEQDFIDMLPDSGSWIQTSYNTKHGVHLSGGTPLRKNYAGIGFAYDPIRDAFIPLQPYPSWILSEETCDWNPPVEYPLNGQKYQWDENSVSWSIVTD